MKIVQIVLIKGVAIEKGINEYRGKSIMEMTKSRKIVKRYMYFCKNCGYLSFHATHCEQCGGEQLEETPKRYGLTNLACIRMAVMDFERMKQEFRREALGGLEGGR